MPQYVTKFCCSYAPISTKKKLCSVVFKYIFSYVTNLIVDKFNRHKNSPSRTVCLYNVYNISTIILHDIPIHISYHIRCFFSFICIYSCRMCSILSHVHIIYTLRDVHKTSTLQRLKHIHVLYGLLLLLLYYIEPTKNIFRTSGNIFTIDCVIYTHAYACACVFVLRKIAEANYVEVYVVSFSIQFCQLLVTD